MTRRLMLLIALVVFVAACGGDDADPDTSIAAAGTVATTAAPTTTAPAATTTAARTTTLSEGLVAVPWAPPFTVALPDDWGRGRHSAEATTLTSNGSTVVLTKEGADSVDAWVEESTTSPELIASEPSPVEIGGASGRTSTSLSATRPPTRADCAPTPCHILSFSTS